MTKGTFHRTTLVMSAENEKFDSQRLQRELEIEKLVDREFPSEREVQTLAREVFSALVVRSGDPADRRNVEAAWKQTKTVIEVYLLGFGEIKPLHGLFKQRKIRARLLLT